MLEPQEINGLIVGKRVHSARITCESNSLFCRCRENICHLRFSAISVLQLVTCEGVRLIGSCECCIACAGEGLKTDVTDGEILSLFW